MTSTRANMRHWQKQKSVCNDSYSIRTHQHSISSRRYPINAVEHWPSVTQPDARSPLTVLLVQGHMIDSVGNN